MSAQGGTNGVTNPNVASGSSSTPQFLSTVGSKATVIMGQTCPDHTTSQSVSTSYQRSNSETAGTSPTRVSGTGTSLIGQPSLSAVMSNIPSFEQLQPKNMSTAPGPIGTDYKP